MKVCEVPSVRGQRGDVRRLVRSVLFGTKQSALFFADFALWLAAPTMLAPPSRAKVAVIRASFFIVFVSPPSVWKEFFRKPVHGLIAWITADTT
jgi:hypothetical protein